MREIDVNSEWRMLSASYAAMEDEELETLAEEAYELTDIARQALQAELSRRRLPIQLRQSPAPASAPPTWSESGYDTDDRVDQSLDDTEAPHDSQQAQKERSRLSARYAELEDEELETLAQEASGLTGIARQALQAEISRRELEIELQPPPAAPAAPAAPQLSASGFDIGNLIDLQRTWSLDHAKWLKEVLNKAGVPVFFGPDRLEDPKLIRSGTEQGVDVRVRDFDQQRAYGALAHAKLPEDRQQAQEEEEKEEIPDYSPRCPKCHSTEIVFQGLDLDPVTRSAFDSKYSWSCDNCGHVWKDDGIESEK